MSQNDAAMNGRYRLARQLGGCGAFAEVAVAVRPATRSLVSPAVSLPQDTDFVAGAIFGAAHALEVLTRVGGPRGGFHVEITEIRSMLVDSTEALVAYSSSMAVFDAFRISSEPMTLDMRTRSVIISPFTSQTQT